ncbi:GspH/FimT family pseudopilin [Psychrobacter sp. 16-MNA-CIBAN-0192]|uniref:GspH/FimT family pseudopilin n=1 Tax=Psychrobacter sp. 16-MNA-CIBAN-0192 TaxID=3140448 RepID=UPI0033346F82
MKTFVNKSLYRQPKSSSGFTLIELMVTIAVLAIIVSIAAPNISNQLANQRVKSTTATLQNALKEAKVESVIRRQDVEVTINNNGTAAGSIVITGGNSLNITTYSYSVKSTVKAVDGGGVAVTNIKFKPSKTADTRTFTICDSTQTASPRQITVSRVANITTNLGGTCP